MVELICVKELQTKHLSFKEGEIYEATEINNNWWVVDAVGIKKCDVDEHFKIKEQ